MANGQKGLKRKRKSRMLKPLTNYSSYIKDGSAADKVMKGNPFQPDLGSSSQLYRAVVQVPSRKWGG